MTRARIYRPDKTAMQSGTKGMEKWLFEFIPEKPYFIDDLMGWTGMPDTLREVRLVFPTREAAVSYAVEQKIPYEIHEPNRRTQVKKAYADNFKYASGGKK